MIRPLVLAMIAILLSALALPSPARADIPRLPIQLKAWGGNYAISSPGYQSGLKVAFVNMTMTSSVPAGSLLVVFIQGAFQNAKATLTPSASGVSFALAQNIEYHQFSSGGFGIFGEYRVGMFIWYGTTTTPVTQIDVHNATQPGNLQIAQFEFALAYANATGIGATAATNGTASQLHHNSTLTTTKAVSTTAFFAWNVQNSVNVVCPGNHAISLVRGDGGETGIGLESASVGTPAVDFGFCRDQLISAAGYDSNTNITAQGTPYTFLWNSYLSGNNWDGQLAEVRAAPVPPPPDTVSADALSGFWVMIFISGLAVIVMGTYILRRDYL